MAKRYSIDDSSKSRRRQAPGAVRGHAGPQARQGGLRRPQARAGRAGQDAVRLLRLHRHARHGGPSSARSRRSRKTIKQTLVGRGPAEGCSTRSSMDFTARWRAKTECAEGFKTTDCRQRPDADPDADAALDVIQAYAITYTRMPPREWNAASYDRISDPQLAMARDVIDRLDLRGDERVLDAGCGSGRVTEELLERVPDGHVVAVDGSEAMVEQTQGAPRRPRRGVRVRPARPDARASRWTRSSRPRRSTGSTTTSGCSRACTPRCKPGGRFAAQCGGYGNIANVVGGDRRGRPPRRCAAGRAVELRDARRDDPAARATPASRTSGRGCSRGRSTRRTRASTSRP